VTPPPFWPSELRTQIHPVKGASKDAATEMVQGSISFTAQLTAGLRNNPQPLANNSRVPGTSGALCQRFETAALARAMPFNPQEVGVIALKNILVATDFSEPAAAAFRYGSELARRFDASLHVLHVVDDLAGHTGPVPGMPTDVGVLQVNLEQDARANLETLLPEPDRTALDAHLEIAVSAWPGQAILGYARDAEIDLIIVGTHGRTGLARLFLGSVAQLVARSATCPVLTVRAHARDFIHPDALQKVERGELRH